MTRGKDPVQSSGKATEKALRESEELNRRIIEALPCGMVRVSVDGSITLANTEAQRILGLSFNELTQRYVADFDSQTFWEDGSPCRVEDYPVSKCLQTRQSQPAAVIGVRRPAGDISWALYTAVPLTDFNTGAAIGAVVTFLDITERKRAEQAVRESEARFQAQYRGIPVPTYTWRNTGTDFVLIDYNTAAEVITGGLMAEKLGVTASAMYEDSLDILDDFATCYRDQVSIQREMTYTLRTTGEGKEFAVTYVYVPPDLVMVHTEDITERKRLESQLLQAQKMESIGRLAGGVAHDFNNLLTAILGYAELAEEMIVPEHPALDALRRVQQATGRAAALTQQLLAFARKQRFQPRVVNLNDLISELHTILRPLIPENIEIALRLTSALGTVRLDPGQMEQVLLNLAVNARDAMSQGGTLTIATRNVTLKQAPADARASVTPGRYVQVTVTDTGPGLTEEAKSHLFEPFFTTKEVGKGTGLGLATCYGIVQQSGGSIWVKDPPGQGTTFVIVLPRANEAKSVEESSQPSARALPAGTETILLAEDEALLRDISRQTLQAQGYRVLEATNGREALEAIANYPGEIALLLTDVVMPDMGGWELAERLRTTHPQLKVLFISGYTEESIPVEKEGEVGLNFLPKPFTQETLAQKVRAVLDASRINTEP